MLILAVESSCDETSVAILEDGKKVLSNIVLSQIDIHKIYGGVVPEIASRNHVKHVTMVFEEALKEANVKVNDLDLVAVTNGPGLIGSLLVGINAATAFAYANHLPIMDVNHLAGHIYAANIDHEMRFPLIALLVSGGHTELIYMKNHFDFEIIGSTLDDAVGEAYDKVARTLGLPYPGGPVIDRLAQEGKDTYELPRVYLEKDSYDFSFSGLKSAVINKVHNLRQKNEEVNVKDMATSFQNSVMDVLVSKTKRAVSEYKVNQVIIAGGVAANKELRKRITNELTNVEVLIPKFSYCTDNAAMIGAAAYIKSKKENPLENYILKGFSTKDLA
ncbi:MAG: tRNA (adenosine(37)-N6)-threonylcarbamoyltransferase complex transferase subunit TsaD [Acholeplasma sp.]|nr:tRNA (adenosine(37)-N6)-threonylcarbamoyltransferase complex transferase subunit TsaD [Acholeplasma sp.]